LSHIKASTGEIRLSADHRKNNGNSNLSGTVVINTDGDLTTDQQVSFSISDIEKAQTMLNVVFDRCGE